jgi:hypothetical protein
VIVGRRNAVIVIVAGIKTVDVGRRIDVFVEEKRERTRGLIRETPVPIVPMVRHAHHERSYCYAAASVQCLTAVQAFKVQKFKGQTPRRKLPRFGHSRNVEMRFDF